MPGELTARSIEFEYCIFVSVTGALSFATATNISFAETDSERTLDVVATAVTAFGFTGVVLATTFGTVVFLAGLPKS